jgi:hypothetical protein
MKVTRLPFSEIFRSSNTRFPYQMVVESASRKWLTSKDFQYLIPTVSKDFV